MATTITANNLTNATIVVPDNDDSDDNRVQLIVAVAALVVSFAALFVSLVQLLQQYSLSAKGYSNCNSKIIGPWADFTKRKIIWNQFRFEVRMTVPVLFVAPPKNHKGPLGEHQDKPIVYMNGTRENYIATHTWQQEEFDKQQNARKSSDTKEAIHTADNEMASWLALMMAIQRMESESRKWQAARLASYVPQGDSQQSPRETVHTLAVGVQEKRRSWDTMPDGLSKPYATSTIAHFVEMMAMLGVYWKEFDRNENKFRAQGNGFSVTGSEVANLGISFTFQKVGKTWFQENRLVPNDLVKELCFGFCPTIFRPKKNFALYADEPKDISTLQLATKSEMSEMLVSFGCNTQTVNYFRDRHDHVDHTRYSHLFPVPFEMLGMVGVVLQLPSTGFTMLPNPTFFHWDKSFFSLRKLLLAFKEAVDEALDHPSNKLHRTNQIGQIIADMRRVADADKNSMAAARPNPKLAPVTETTGAQVEPYNERTNATRRFTYARKPKLRSAARIFPASTAGSSALPASNGGTLDSRSVQEASDNRQQASPAGTQSTLELRLTALHEAIRRCDAYLQDEKIFPYVQHVFCMHVQEVLKYLNPTPKEQEEDEKRAYKQQQQQQQQHHNNNSTNTPNTPNTPSSPDDPNFADPEDGYTSLQQLDSASLIARHHLLARLYMLYVRKQVSSAPIPTVVNLDAPDDDSARRSLDDLELRPRHTMSSGFHIRQSSTGSGNGAANGAKGGKPGGAAAGVPYHATRQDIDDIWCTLMFRMVCWLMLHDFHKKDLQLSKSDLFDSRLPVYIL